MAQNHHNNTILIVDDNQVNLKIVVKNLTMQGFETITARTGEMGVRRAKFAVPDLILLDIMMPGISGFETCRQLKADEKTKHIPIIFMTALNNVTDKVKGFEVGGVDYLTKPIEKAELLARIQTHLTIHRLQKELELRNKDLEHLNAELARLAQIDGLTEIANRRHFDDYLAKEWRRLKREQEYLSLILIDLDFFKQYNDCYGHLAGDDCLKQVAQLLNNLARRPADLATRYGGEEFAIILPYTNRSGALHVAGKIQHQLAELKIPHANSPIGPYLTCSMGVSTMIPQENNSLIELIDMADKALYQSKNQGRNQLTTS